MFSVIVAAAIGLLVLAGAILILMRARDAGIAIQRKLVEIHQETYDLHRSFQGAREDQNVWAARFQKEMIDTRERLLRDSANLARIVEQTTQMVVRRPLEVLTIDPSILEATPESELLRRAESIATLRPLVPYPRWATDADRNNPDLAYQLRRWFWQYFHDRNREASIVVSWHLGTRLRLFLGNDESAQIYVAGCIEPNEFAFLDRILRPGMTFLDAGANNGIYSVFASKRVGPEGLVWAFEPSSRELERLRFNLDLNGLAARIFPVALADVNGAAEFTVSDSEHQGQNTLGAFGYPDVKVEGKQQVEVRRLDDLIAENPLARIDVLKIDVEGAELRLLRGAAGTIERYRPFILIEVSEASLQHQGATRDDLLAFLRLHQYRIYAFDRVTGLPFPATSGIYSDNMVGAPEEKPLPEAAWHWPARI